MARWLWVACALSLSGCGHAEPPRSAEPSLPPERGPEAPAATSEASGSPARRVGHAAPEIEVQGEVGGLDQDAVNQTMQSASNDVDRCWAAGSDRNELVAGTIRLVLGVGGEGRAVYAYVEQSTLGDGVMHRCMLDALSKRAWPKPVGGKVGIVRTSLSFDLPKDVRAATKWPSSRATSALASSADEIAACKRGVTGTFTATVYLKEIELPPPDAGSDDAGDDAGDAGPTQVGAAISVGVASSDEHGAAAVECLERVLAKAVYPTPGDWPAKLGFSL